MLCLVQAAAPVRPLLRPSPSGRRASLLAIHWRGQLSMLVGAAATEMARFYELQ